MADSFSGISPNLLALVFRVPSLICGYWRVGAIGLFRGPNRFEEDKFSRGFRLAVQPLVILVVSKSDALGFGQLSKNTTKVRNFGRPPPLQKPSLAP